MQSIDTLMAKSHN